MKPYLIIESRIEQLKEKYNIEDEVDYNKLSKLDYTRTTLKTISIASGILFVVDLIIPDPVFLIDEVTLGTITGSLSMIDNIIENKIEDLITNGKVEVSLEDIKNITNSTSNVLKKVKRN